MVKSPKSRRLLVHQLKAWHLDELIPHTMHESMKFHARVGATGGPSRSTDRGALESLMFSCGSCSAALSHDQSHEAIQTTAGDLADRLNNNVELRRRIRRG